jgi:hypothetical protein
MVGYSNRAPFENENCIFDTLLLSGSYGLRSRDLPFIEEEY